MALLRTENLTHVYSIGTPFERVAVRDINFEINEGEYVGVIGHTGSGKSTFIKHLNGLLKPTSGNVFFGGRDIHSNKKFTRETRFKVGLVFQYPEYQLFETSVYEDIAFGPKNMGFSDAEVRERVYEAAGFASIDEELLQKSPFELSGGQKRRAAIAGVIAMRPDVLILDEPTAGLDPRGRDEIISNIMEYKKGRNAAIIMVTHSMEEIARAVDRIVLFEKSAIVMEGTPSEIFSQGEKLREMGLAVPKACQIAERLKELGLNFGGDVYTIESMKNALIAMRKGEKSAF